MITNSIPHNSLYIPVSLIFRAQFNNPVAGRYSFNTPANQGLELLKYQNNTWYFIDSLSIGGTISDEQYCRSVFQIPTLVLKKAITGERVYVRDITFPKYSENRDLSVFTKSDKGTPRTTDKAGQNTEDRLIADLTGILNQIPETVGQAEIALHISLAVFQIDEKSYNVMMRGVTSAR